MRFKPNQFVDIRTLYEGEISWWWTNEKLHDNAYSIKVNEAIDKKVAELEKKYNVRNDIRYCCQWEGKLLFGENLDEVTKAINELALYLSKFTGIRPL